MIDAFASAPWYVDHIAPTWLALPPEHRGRFYVSHLASAAAHGLPDVHVRRLPDDGRPILVVSYGDLRAAQMAGRQMVALGQHGAGQSYSSDHAAYPGGQGQGRASLFLVPNRHAEARTRQAYPRARVELVGCPKLDTLPTKARAAEPVIAFSFHWSSTTIAPEMISAWDHYRTAIPAIARHRTVIGHAHPRYVATLRRWYKGAGIEVIPSFADVLARADVYVCDNSSSMFEFASTGRPVVVLNTPQYRRSVEHGLRFWEASGVGVNCDDRADLDDAIGRALEDGPATRAAREAALDIVYAPRRGGAQLAASALVDWAGSTVAHSDRNVRLTQVQRFRGDRDRRPVASRGA